MRDFSWRTVFSVLLLTGTMAWAHDANQLYFEKNTGQTAASVRYLARTRQATIFVTDQETVFSLRGAGKAESAVRLSFPNASRQARWREEQPQPLTVSSYIGDRSHWRDSIPTYRQLRRSNVYPGIDLVYYGTAREMEYDFVLHPGARPSHIRLKFAGAQRLQLSPTGDLEIVTPAGTLLHRAPKILQHSRPVAGRFRLLNPHEVGLEVTGPYDPAEPLTIDPVVTFSSFYGGEGDDRVTASRNASIVGYTNSIAFPGANTPGAGGYDAFYMSFGRTPRIIYLGGSRDDRAYAVWNNDTDITRVRTEALAFGGETESSDFPVFYRGRFQSFYSANAQVELGTFRGASQGFVFSLNSQPSAGLYSSYSALFGGSGRDRILTLDGADDSIAVGGETDSPDLPIATSQAPYAGGKDGFAAIFTQNVSASSLTRIFTTYWGGSGDDAVRAIYGTRSIIIAGTTTSDGLPVVRGIQTERRGGVDTYVSFHNGLLNPSLLASTYWGGSGDDLVRVLVPLSCGFWLGGDTSSSDLRTEQAAQPAFGGGESDGWLAQFDLVRESATASAFHLRHAGYWGGSGRDTLQGLAVYNPTINPSNLSQPSFRAELLAAGTTNSLDFPRREASQDSFAGGDTDAWYGLYSPIDGRLASSYFGGSGADEGVGIGQLESGPLLLAGNSDSPVLPHLDPVEGNQRSGGVDAFVARLSSPSLQLTYSPYAALDAFTAAVIPPAVLPDPSSSAIQLRVRSSDPSRLTLSLSRTAVGTPELTRLWTGASLSLYLHGLASEGTADVILSADGFAERRFPVHLRPLSGSLFVGTQGSSGLSTATQALLKLKQNINVQLTFRAVSADGSETAFVSFPRPGIPDAVPQLLSSDSSVVSVSGQFTYADTVCCLGSTLSLSADQPGQATLSVTLGGRLLTELPAVVEPIRLRFGGQAVPGFQTNLFLGADTSGVIIPARVTVEDPETAQLSAGSAPSSTIAASDVRALSSFTLLAGTTGRPIRLRAQSPLTEDTIFEVPLTSPQFSFSGPPAGYLPVRSTGTVTVSLMTPSATPGGLGRYFSSEPLTFRLRSEDPSIIAVDQPTLVVAPNSELSSAIAIRAVATEGETTLVLDGAPGLEPRDNRLRLRIGPPSSGPNDWISIAGAATLGRDLETTWTCSGAPLPDGLTFTSSDPTRLLLRAPNQTTGAGSVSLSLSPTATSSSVTLQALAGEGTVDITISAPGRPTLTRRVTLAKATAFWDTVFTELLVAPQAQLAVIYGPDLAATGMVSAAGGTFSQTVRPGGVAPSFEILNSDPRIVSVSRNNLAVTLTPREPGLATLDLSVDGAVNPRARLLARVAPRYLSFTPPTDPLGKDLYRTFRAGSGDNSTIPITITSADPSLLRINGQSRVQFQSNESVRLEALSDQGFAHLRLESPGYATSTFDVELAPATVRFASVPSEVVLPQSQIYVEIGLNGEGRRVGPPIVVELISRDPQVAPSSGPITLNGRVTVSLRALAPGETTLELRPPAGIAGAASRSLTVRLARLRSNSYRLPDGFQTIVSPTFENGGSVSETAYTVRSLHPDLLRVAPRSPQGSAASPSAASLDLPSGRSDFYIQGYGVGEAVLEFTSPSFTTTQMLVSVIPATLTLSGPNQLPLAARLALISVLPEPASSLSYSITFRSDRAPLPLRLESSDPSVAVANPASIAYPTGSEFILRALKAGTTNLRLILPDGSSSPLFPLTITPSPITLYTPKSIGKDLLGSGSITTPDSSNLSDLFKVTSTDPALLTLSTSPTDPGTTSINTLGGREFYFHALGEGRSVEVVAESVGYPRSSAQIQLWSSGASLASTPLTNLPPGSTTPVLARLVSVDPVSQQPGDQFARMRPGVSIPIAIQSSNPSVGTVTPASATLSGENVASFTFQAIRPGTTTLSLSAVAGYTTPRGSAQVNATVVEPSFTINDSRIGAWLGTPLLVSPDRPLPENTTAQVSVEGLGLSTTLPLIPRSGFASFEVIVNAQIASGEGTLVVAAPGYATKRFPLRVLPSGFIFTNSSWTLSVGRFVAVEFKPVALDPATLTPVNPSFKYRVLPVSGPTAPGAQILLVANDNPNALAVMPTEIPLGSGLDLQYLSLQTRAVGQGTLRLNAPARFTTPTAGHIISIQVVP